MQQDDGLQSFFRLIASTQPSSRLAKNPIESISPESEVLDMSCAEDSDSASSRSSPPKSNSSPAKEERSREWMFSGILTVRNDEEWMRTRKATLTVEEVIEAMGDAFKDTYSSRAPVELTYIVVIGDGSKLEVEASDESVSEFIELPIRGYLAAQRTSRDSWQAWIDQPGFTWTTVTGGMLSYPPFREDQMRIKDEDGTWLVLTSWGRRKFFESQGCSWAFDGSLNLPPRDRSDFGSVIDFVQLVRDSFVATAGRQEQWPSGIKFLCVHCDASSMNAAGDAQEAVVPVRGFLQTTQSKIRKWEMWLPRPWDVRPMRGGLGGNKEFEEAAMEARSEGSKWVEVLVEGTIGRNNALRLADAKQASALPVSVICHFIFEQPCGSPG